MPRLTARRGRPTTGDLGARIRAERERIDLSVAEAAARLNVSRQRYGKMEAATALPYGILLALVDDLGMDVRELCPELFEDD